MNLQTQDTTVISNEKIVEIAFGIVLDRIRRNAPKEDLQLPKTKRLSISRNISSRCIRKFSYQCNETSTSSSQGSSQGDNPDFVDVGRNTDIVKVEHQDAATNVTPPATGPSGGDSGCYYMRSDTVSKDTVLACHNSIDTETTKRQQADASSCVTGRTGCTNVTTTDARTFRVKIDQQQLSRALGTVSSTELPSELLVDVNCSANCRVAEVSLKQSQEKQCVLSLRVDSGLNGGVYGDGGGGGGGNQDGGGSSRAGEATPSSATAIAVNSDREENSPDALEDNSTAKDQKAMSPDEENDL